MITIVVLLILAGISIAMLSGENGIIRKTQESKIETRVGDIKETAEIIRGEYVTTHIGQQPTAKNIIEELIRQGKIEENEVVDFGDSTGIGILNINDKIIEILGVLGDIALQYELDGDVIKLYPIIKSSKTYGDFAVQQIKGKTDAEICQMFVDGCNYWNVKESWGDPEYENIYDLMDYWKSQGWIDENCATSYDLAKEHGYTSLASMGITWKYFKPEEYNNLEELVQNYTIHCSKYNETINGTTQVPYHDYMTIDSGTYEFILTVGDSSVTTKVNFETIGEDGIFITDGNGTILGLKENCYGPYDKCQASSRISKIVIPEKIGEEEIIAIGENAFSHMSGIVSLEMPNTIKTIEDDAFESCSSLQDIKFSNNLISIGAGAFYQADLLSIEIPDSVTSIGSSAFGRCYNLISVKISNNVTRINSATFYWCSSLTNITIPENVTLIGGSAFFNCYELTNITIPESLESIGSSAFYNCYELTNITIPASVVSIGSSAFYNCYELTNITIPEGVTTICDSTFENCDNLVTIIIPDTVTSIGVSAFKGCDNLTGVTIPNNVTSIGKSAFKYCSGITNIIIPDKVTIIEEAVFESCSNLTSVTIPNSVTSIGKSAFKYCKKLANLVIPNQVTTIGEDAFSNCSSLESIAIPESVVAIGKSAFNQCGKLTSVELSKNITCIEASTFNFCRKLTNITIPEGVTSIGNAAFCYCDSLTNIIIPSTVTSIASDTFSLCRLNINIKKETDSISGSPWGASSARVIWNYTE